MTAEVTEREDLDEAPGLPGNATEDTLRVAVAASRSWRGVLRAFNLTSPRHGRRYQEACDEWGIDYSHFSARTWSDEQLRYAAGAAQNWHELMQGLGYPKDSGSARATIRKHAQRVGVDLSRLTELPTPEEDGPFQRPAEARHLRAAGAYLVAGACALSGCKVSWPLEPAIYDLLVDTGSIQRVQVKTTTWLLDGQWACKITHSESGAKAWYTGQEIDYFGVVDGDLAVYMIPVGLVDGLGTIVLRRYDAFRLPTLNVRAGID